jgi:predicted CXXCH cytochrome family protein
MKKIGLSFIFALLLFGLLSVTALAAESDHNKTFEPAKEVISNPNAHGTTDGINVNDGTTFSSVIKSNKMINNLGVEGDHKTHGSYQNNTNSCSSCHQTHTSQAKSLLFADSTYNTCTACHDGTLGFYNVFQNGKKYFNSESTAGTFGGSHSGNMSVHLATGALQVKAAPGGNKTSTDAGSWGASFTCASCHAPHGSYSSRLLHYNPANMGNMTPAQGGIKAAAIDVVNYSVKDAGVSASSDKFRAVRGTKAEHGLTDAKYDSIPADAVVVMVYEKNSGNTSYAKTTNPWLYGYSATSNGRNYLSRLFTVTKDQISTVLNADGTIKGYVAAEDYTNKIIDQNDYKNGQGILAFKYDKGLVYAKTTEGKALLNSALSGDIGRAYVVTLDLKPVPGAVSNVVTKHNVESLWGTGGAGVAVSNWCSTCHTDYLAKSGGQKSIHGNYDGKTYYGHTTNSSTYTCLRCHYSHGTDVEIMVDGDGATIHDLQKSPTVEPLGKNWSLDTARKYMMDKNPSSALKKFTNMSGCWACHNSSKAASLKNTNRDELHPDGMILDPSMKSYQPRPVTSSIEDNNSGVVYTGSWTKNQSNSNASGGSMTFTNELNAAAEFSFTGKGISLIGTKGTNYGRVDIYLDGNKVSTVDLNNASTVYKSKMYENLTLVDGPHTIKLVNIGPSNPDLFGAIISLDAIEVTTMSLD